MAKRNRGEGTIYYSEARKQWIGQFTKTIEGEKIRKSVYGATKNEVSEKGNVSRSIISEIKVVS